MKTPLTLFIQSISENVTVTAYVSMTTFKMDPLEFLVPVNRSLCH